MKKDVVIIGAGAAGLMCAIEAGKRGRSVVVVEHNAGIGEKIRISGGGRCNFTNVTAENKNFLSANPHFCKSALARFTAEDFIALVEKHGINYHEKKLGQLFCDEGAQQIIDMLLKECAQANVEICTGCTVSGVRKDGNFIIVTNVGEFVSASLVIATGGLSIPKLGATNFGYSTAKQFGLKVTKLKPGLVPLTVAPDDLEFFRTLSGVSLDAIVRCNGVEFRENILFTHRGLSGPAILQISSYWNDGDVITINVLPDIDILQLFLTHHQSKKEITTVLDQHLPKRFVDNWCDKLGGSKLMHTYSRKELERIAHDLHNWQIIPNGTEGFGKAEVTV
ncbi:MAG: aminoacetone oxidase family FAD-binding enzyme, partial [Ignavibacteriales bacterium]|nr:aminoacetone oxidase family FAD-binding enzyme [Ignavibacteriales bacterium]